MSDPVLLVQRRGPVLVLTLNRPHRRHAVDSELGVALRDAVRDLDADSELRVAVITGAGEAFCAGMDLKAFAEHGEPEGLADLLHRTQGKPLIAAVEGPALAGGLELALSCDIVIAGATAVLGIPEVRVGLFAGGGGVLRLAHRIPYGWAMRMALTGAPVDADTALRLGIVTEVTAAGGALDAAVALAEQIAAQAPLGVGHSRNLVQAAAGRTEDEFWTLQEPALAQVLGSRDALEGATAFAERRAPRWTAS